MSEVPVPTTEFIRQIRYELMELTHTKSLIDVIWSYERKDDPLGVKYHIKRLCAKYARKLNLSEISKIPIETLCSVDFRVCHNIMLLPYWLFSFIADFEYFVDVHGTIYCQGSPGTVPKLFKPTPGCITFGFKISYKPL